MKVILQILKHIHTGSLCISGDQNWTPLTMNHHKEKLIISVTAAAIKPREWCLHMPVKLRKQLFPIATREGGGSPLLSCYFDCNCLVELNNLIQPIFIWIYKYYSMI